MNQYVLTGDQMNQYMLNDCDLSDIFQADHHHSDSSDSGKFIFQRNPFLARAFCAACAESFREQSQREVIRQECMKGHNPSRTPYDIQLASEKHDDGDADFYIASKIHTEATRSMLLK